MTARPPAPTYAEAKDRGLPVLSENQMESLLWSLKKYLSSPVRAYVLCRFAGAQLTSYGVSSETLGELAGSGFAQDCRLLWDNYEIGAVVPVIMARASPTPFVGLTLAKLPWGPQAPGGWCPRCGARLAAAGEAHACPESN